MLNNKKESINSPFFIFKEKTLNLSSQAIMKMIDS